MRTTDIIKELHRLPLNKRIYVIEKTIQSIRQQEDSNQMTLAAERKGEIPLRDSTNNGIILGIM